MQKAIDSSNAAVIKGFEHVKRFWDPQHQLMTAKILPGECYVSCSGEIVSTVLGSCVAACIRDPIAKVGGMNHFMLPVQVGAVGISRLASLTPALCYGNWAMDFLLNEVLKAGGKKDRLEVKVFGGGRVLAGMTNIDVGKQNIEFIESYLKNEGLRVVAEDVGDVYPRKILYFPDTGKVKMKKLKVTQASEISAQEQKYLDSMAKKPKASDVELF